MKIERRGGRREGSGSPKGQLKKRTQAMRAVADEALVSGESPLEVLLDNMRFYHKKADVLLTAILTGINEKKKPLELLEAMQELGNFRKLAGGFAVDAAPYVHARLSATTVDATITHKTEEIEAAFKVIEGSLEAVVTGEIIPARQKSKVAA